MGEIFGWGKKNTADVNTKGQLKTYAESFTTDYDAAHDGDAYTMDIDGVTVGADGNTLALMENYHSSKEMVVTSFRLTTNENKDDQDIEIYVGGAFTYLGNGTAVTPQNMASGKTAGAPGGVSNSFYVSDGNASTMTTITAGNLIGRMPMYTKGINYEYVKKSGWHVPPGNCFYLTAAKDSKFSGSISFYYK